MSQKKEYTKTHGIFVRIPEDIHSRLVSHVNFIANEENVTTYGMYSDSITSAIKFWLTNGAPDMVSINAIAEANDIASNSFGVSPVSEGVTRIKFKRDDQKE